MGNNNNNNNEQDNQRGGGRGNREGHRQREEIGSDSEEEIEQRNSLNETQGQTVSRYVNGLTTSIQDRIGLQVFWDVHEAQNMAMKAQQLEKELKERELKEKKTNYGNNNNYPRKAADSYVPNKEKKEIQPIQRNNYKGQNYRGESSQNNDINQNRNQRPNHGPYTRATGDVCYRCFQPGHRSNNCPKRKQANLVEGIDEADDHSGNYDDDYDGAEFAYEDNNEVVNLMMNHTALEEDEVLSMLEKPQAGSSNFLAISRNSREFEDIIKEVGFMYPIVLKGLMVTNVVSSHVPKEVQEILSDTFNVTDLYEYHEDEALYSEDNSEASSFKEEESDVERLAGEIEEQIDRCIVKTKRS
uniref:CCHC-type domain-containing protein n=1 Tax=Populus alba TaxID=43335 RepID=A0A4U5N9V9_POPAL|nr:hypothetical protein D5086_0000280550 [Populus alba]